MAGGSRPAWRVKLCDFGLARAPDQEQLTRTGHLAGTPLYLAPEQVGPSARPADERSDRFNLGLILYQLLTGRHPFAPDGVTLRLDLIERCEPVWPTERNPLVPPRLAGLVMNLLARKADLRKSAGDVRDLLARFDGRDLPPPPARPDLATGDGPLWTPTGSTRPMRVYLSALTPDVTAFRNAVAQALRADPQRYEVVESPAGLPTSAGQVDAWLRALLACDAYVGVVGFCYGPVPALGDVSLAEREYRAAVDAELIVWTGLPPKRAVDVDAIDTDGRRVAAWREELAAGGSSTPATPAEAAALVRAKLAAHPWPPAEESATGRDVWLDRYLAWVEGVHATLELPGARGARRLPLPLDQVYVALCGERTGAYELTQAHALLEDELDAFVGDARALPELARRRLRARLFRSKSPYMSAVWDRRQSRGEGPPPWTRTVSLADAFREERWLTILGDPGSGKTTLGRWLAGRLAQAYRAGGEGSPVLVPCHRVDPTRPYDPRLVDLGPARLPILAHASDFADELARAKAVGKTLLLVEWLPRLTWKRVPPTAGGTRIPETELDRLFRSALAAGRAVVILDGLDEVGDEADRRDVVRMIEWFLGDWVPTAAEPPGLAGGNQLVVTSRIAGYQAAPLTARQMTHVTVEPMGRPAVERFCDNWMRAVYALTALDRPAADRDQAGRAEAARLQAAVFDPDTPGIAEVASNPLLVTTLAMLFRDSAAAAADKGLPKSRAELYQRIIELLIEDWRAVGLTADAAVFVLAPLAAHIHEHYPSGLIDGSELSELVVQHLARYEGLPADSPPPWLADRVRRFVKLVRDNVGLLAAHGEELYGFLHLTFQEYLAARHLLRNRDGAAAELAARAHDPRWREPVLLALGYASWKWPPAEAASLVRGFLAADDPLGPAVPRATLLCVDALADGRRFPTGVLAPVLQRLLAVYAVRDVLRRSPRLRTRVEDAALRLRQSCDRAAMDEVLSAAIRSPEPAGQAAATAALVRELGWFSPLVVAALAANVANDDREWGWPIEQSLRDLVSPEWPDVIPPQPTQPDAAVRAVREELRKFESGELISEAVAGLREAEKAFADWQTYQASVIGEVAGDPREGMRSGRRSAEQTLRLAVIEEELQRRIEQRDQMACRIEDLQGRGRDTLDDLLRRLDTAQAELVPSEPDTTVGARGRLLAATGGHARHILRRALRVRTALPASRVRGALESPELTARLVGSPSWLALFVAVYGGYANCRAVQSDREYWELSRFLGHTDSRRELLIDIEPDRYAGQFGNKDISYNIAVLLDHWNNSRGRLRTAPVEFTAAAVTRESSLDRLLVAALQDDTPSLEMVPELRRIWTGPAARAAQFDALAALVSLGEDGVGLLAALPANPADQAFLSQTLDHLARTREVLSDAAYRSRMAVFDELATLDESDPNVWVDIVDQVLSELVELAETPLPVPAALRNRAPQDYRAALDADALYCAANGHRDINYHFTTIGESVVASDDPDWLRPFLLADRGPNRRRGKLPFRWEVEPIPFRTISDDEALPIHGLQTLLTLNLDAVQLGLAADWIANLIVKAAARPDAQPDQRVELAALSIAVGRFDLALELLPELDLPLDREPLSALERFARDIADPNWKARSLLALVRWAVPWGTDRAPLLIAATQAAADVGNLVCRFELLEGLLPFTRPDGREQLVSKLRTAAEAIVDPDDHARALARLVRVLPGAEGIEVWAEAFRSSTRIADPDRRAETLQLLGGFAPRDPATAGAREMAVRSLPTLQQQARASNRLARQFLHNRPVSLEAKVAARPQLWTPILVSAAMREVLTHFRGPDRAADIWQRLTANPTDPYLVSELSLLGGEDGLRLTRRAADAISAVVWTGDDVRLRLLLPLLQSPDPTAVPVVEGWTHHPNPFIAHHAVLILAEGRRSISLATVPALLALHSTPCDRSRYRATLLLGSPYQGQGGSRDTQRLRSSRLDPGVLEAIADADLATWVADRVYGRHYPLVAGNLIHDSPNLVARWLEQGGDRGPAVRRAVFLLRAIYKVDDSVWPILLAGLKVAKPEALLSVFEAVCKLVYLNYKLSDAMQIQITQSIRNNASLLAINKYLMFQINFKTNSKIPDEADYWLHSARLVTDAVIALADADGPDLVSRLDMHLLQTATSVRDVLADPDDAVLLERVRGLGACFFCRLDGKDDGAKLAAGRIVRTPESFAPLVRWLAAALAAEPAYNCWYPRTEALLRVTADAAARLPDAFLKVATPLRLNALLTTAARSSGKYGRRAAVRLLGYLRSATVEVIETILATLKDDDPLVQAAALEVTREFCEVAPSAIRRLTAALVDDSGVVALGAARILTALSRQQWLDPGARTDILHALATALADRRSHRYVVLLTCTEPLQIQPIGRLDQAFHTALLVATGVLDAVS